VLPIQIFSLILVVITAAGVVYLGLALFRVVDFVQRKAATVGNEFAPSVTILKPIAGIEPGLYEHLASFCAQDYPDYDVVFCLHDAGDPAMVTIERVRKDFPQTKTRVAIGHNDAMANPKIANLAKPGAEITGDVVVIADSDVLVAPDYLRAIAAEFSTETTGATTCLYGGIPNATWVSYLGAAHVEDEFAPSVLTALALGPLRFCLGATMAVRRNVLERIGGLETLGPYLADDHALGELVSKQGLNVTLCPYPVKTAIPESRFDDLWSHELRWARTRRAQAPVGYAFSFVMYAVPFALLALVVTGGSDVALALLIYAVTLRGALHIGARRALRVTHASRWWLIPLRDLVSLAVWLISLFGRSIRWREVRSTVSRDGKLQ
jgi:ceramide glucosyltransferase